MTRKQILRQHQTDSFKQARGDLTASELGKVIREINSGKDPMEIALDWLITRDRVYHIKSALKHGKPNRAHRDRR